MTYELIICEKPAQAQKVAQALADKHPKKHSVDKVPYYELTHKKKKILVGCAVGHLFTLAEAEKNGWKYPTFNTAWKPIFQVSKTAGFAKKYHDVLKTITKNAKTFTVATDYDPEGSVIGYNIVRFICNKKDAKRMKFSTLTKDELIQSYEKANKHLDFPQIHAGETRHHLDFLFGINLSRALTLSIKNTSGFFKILSIGRVQGPTLRLLAEREKEIKKFKPETYFEIYLDGLLKKEKIKAEHKKGKIKDKEQVTQILKKTKNKKAFISKVKTTTQNQQPPHPFDLTSLQIEAYRCLRVTPKETLSLAQDLYTKGLISYPRTSSQKLPAALNHKKLITKISKQNTYNKLALNLLKSPLTPNEGKKSDPAHPAIYPTGEQKTLQGKKAQLYDLIVRRFLATFGEPAKRETITLEIDVNKEIFVTKGTRTIEKGWHIYYGRFANYKEQTLPEANKDDQVKVKKIYSEEKQTQPPKRYTQASIIKLMESKNLGTKATRSSIVDALYQRNYIHDTSLEVTDLGLKVIDTLKKHSPDIIHEELTAEFEEQMGRILKGKKKQETVITQAKASLRKILENFKKNEKKIGKALSEATKETRKQESLLGPCPKCKKGNLRILYSRKTKKSFAACDQYPKCKTTFSIPVGKILKTDKVCPHCKTPIIRVVRAGKRPFEMCLTINCKSKESWGNNNNKETTQKKSKTK